MAVDAAVQETPRFRLMLAGRWSWLPSNVTLLVGGVIFGGIIGLSLLAPLDHAIRPGQTRLRGGAAAAGSGHLFGTDNFGRDIFTRTLYAARIDLQLGFFSVVFAWLLGDTPSGCSLDFSVAGSTP